jgi:hypothetical protein
MTCLSGIAMPWPPNLGLVCSRPTNRAIDLRHGIRIPPPASPLNRRPALPASTEGELPGPVGPPATRPVSRAMVMPPPRIEIHKTFQPPVRMASHSA